MTTAAYIIDGAVYRWDVGTLSLVIWDGSLSVGSLTIGTVNQGTGGVSAWKVDGSAVTQPVSGTFFQATQPVSIAAAVPVTDNGGSLTVDGTVSVSGTVPISAVSLPLPTDAATQTTLAALNAKVTAVNTGAVTVSSSALPSGAATSALQTQPGVDIGDVTVNNAAGAAAVNIQDGGNSITVDGTVGVSGSVAVTGPLTDFQLRASAVPVSGTVTASLATGANAIGSITNTSFAATQATAANLNATVVGTGTFAAQVTGSVTANAGTNLNTSALALDASISTLNTSVNTLLKPANTLAAVTTVGTVSSQATSYGKTLTFVPVAQGAAGTTQLAAASASNKHKIMGCVVTMSAAGTLKFLDGTGDLTGAMDIAATGGFVLPTSLLPFQQTTVVNTPLSITTTGGAAKGVVVLLTEP